MKYFKLLIQRLIAPLFANEDSGGEKKFDFRKMLLDLLGLDDKASDTDMANACAAVMKDDTDYGALRANCDEAKTKMAANEATIAELTTKIADAHKTRVDMLAESEAKAKLALDGVIAERDAANAKLTTVTAELTAANEKAIASALAFANERKSRAVGLLTLGVESGRISKAEKDSWEKEFANSADFDTVAAKLLKTPAKWKTATAVQVGERGNGGKSATETVLELVNERMEKNAAARKPSDYDTCFAQIKSENPGLFDVMQRSDASKALDVRTAKK